MKVSLWLLASYLFPSLNISVTSACLQFVGTFLNFNPSFKMILRGDTNSSAHSFINLADAKSFSGLVFLSAFISDCRIRHVVYPSVMAFRKGFRG